MLDLQLPTSLVLSPHYYYAKTSSTPFSSLSQAKKFAASLFDHIPQIAHFVVDVYAQDDTYVFVAYNALEIKTRLIEQGANPKLIQKIYLAQEACHEMEVPLRLDEHEALAKVQGIVVAVPTNVCLATPQESQPYFASHTPPKNALSVPGLGSFDLKAYAKPLIGLAAMALLTLLLEYISLIQTSQALQAQTQEVRTMYHLPATSMQLNSILKRLETTAQEQSTLREPLYILSKNRASIKGALERIKATPSSMEMTFGGVTPELETALALLFPKAIQTKNDQQLTLKVQP